MSPQELIEEAKSSVLDVDALNERMVKVEKEYQERRLKQPTETEFLSRSYNL